MFKEQNENRLKQHLIFLDYVHNKTAPDNAIVMYFFAYLQHKIKNNIDEELLKKLKKSLENSEYWSERFEILKLSYNDFVTKKFPEKNEFLEINKL